MNVRQHTGGLDLIVHSIERDNDVECVCKSSSARSWVRNVAFDTPRDADSTRAAATAGSEKSMPVNWLAGKACAMTLMAYPLPQPKSAKFDTGTQSFR